jgi:parallel beta-helix repeat protein
MRFLKGNMVSALTLTLLLASTLTLVFNIHPVVATGTIYIRADGSIDPPDAPIFTLDNATYTLTDNINDSIVVERDNIVVDGNGYTVQGTGMGIGIQLSNRNNVTVCNVEIKEFDYGMLIDSSSSNSMSGNNITAIDDYGICLCGSSGNSIFGNNITANNGYGIELYFSSNYNSISGNNITNDDYGVCIEYSSSNSIFGNNITANNGYGIELYSSSSNSISGNSMTANNWNGIQLDSSSNSNTITGNNITSNDDGIYLSISNNNNIANNIITHNKHISICLSSSDNNMITNNLVAYSQDGMDVGWESNFNSIINNTVTNNWWGGILIGHFLANNTISNNNILLNTYGIWLFSEKNIIYHNNFINNSIQAKVEYLGYVNSWDDGYPSGGNYWSDYNGTDTNSDGLGDTPYVIDADNQDRYPLMHPWSPLPVHNINTGLGYATIQEAINANETLNGHTIFVEAGIYREHVSVNKTIDLIGEGRVVTIIDGYEVDVTANNVAVSGFAVGGFTAFVEGGRGNGIRLQADGCTVDNNTIFNASPYGIWLLNSTNDVISNNVMIANDYNMRLDESSNNTISQNCIKSIESEVGVNLIDSGIELYHSSNNTISQNNMTQCLYGIRIEGSDQEDASNNTVIENNIEYISRGFPSACGIQLDRSSNTVVTRNNITPWAPARGYGAEGISLAGSVNNSIAENRIYRSQYGIDLDNSALNNITSNILTNNYYGIRLSGSSVNSLIGNNVTHDPVTFEGSNETSRIGFGILISSYYSNLLRNNTIVGYRCNFGIDGGYGYYFQDADTSNTVDGKPIYFWGDRQSGQIPSDAGYVAIVNSTNITVEGLDLKNNYQGILIAYSNDTIIRQNNIANNDDGIWLDSSSNSSISENNITANNEYGIYLYSSSSNSIFHNNFINNAQQVISDSVNVWDDGYPSGGNCWSDYTGIDAYSGSYQNITGSDGIGDSPYVIDENNQDRYPLGVFGVHLLGDLNQDGIVNVLDAIQAASAFGSYPGHPKWNEQADINRDGVVNILDVIILANNFGKHSF